MVIITPQNIPYQFYNMFRVQNKLKFYSLKKNEIFMKNGKTVILSFCNSTRMAQGSLENSLNLG